MSRDSICALLFQRIAGFFRCSRANISMIFALSLVPMALAAGTGLDLARAMTVRTQLSEALDSAALAVGNTSGKTPAQLQALAQQYFNANYKADSSFGTPSAVMVATTDNSVTVTTSLSMPTTLLKVVGKDSLDIGNSSTVVWGQQKLWVSLVLDNTGSMSETDATGTSKISALKTATHQLLTMLQNASPTPGDVKVAIVPFTVDTNVGTANVNASWIDWTMWEQPPANYSDTSTSTTWNYYGPSGKKNVCPWTSSNNGYACSKTSSNGGSKYSSTSSISSGLFCPSVDDGSQNSGWYDRYYNGCFNSVKVSSSCSSNCQYTHTWIPNAHSTWTGCIADRNQTYDAQNTAPTTTATKFPAGKFCQRPLYLHHDDSGSQLQLVQPEQFGGCHVRRRLYQSDNRSGLGLAIAVAGGAICAGNFAGRNQARHHSAVRWCEHQKSLGRQRLKPKQCCGCTHGLGLRQCQRPMV